MTRLRAALFLGLILSGGSAAQTNPYVYEILLDTDNNPATGGAVTLVQAGGSVVMQGVDRRVVAIGDPTSHLVLQTEVLQWTGSAFASVSLDTTQYPMSTSPLAIEFGASRASLGNPAGSVAARFHASTISFNDYTSAFTFDPTTGTAFSSIPALGLWGFGIMAVALALTAMLLIRRRRGIAFGFALAALLVAATAWAATITMDGNLSDWAGIAPAVTDPTGDSSIGDPNEDITAGFVTGNATNLYFRIDLAALPPE